jgi:hypothetical protein
MSFNTAPPTAVALAGVSFNGAPAGGVTQAGVAFSSQAPAGLTVDSLTPPSPTLPGVASAPTVGSPSARSVQVTLPALPADALNFVRVEKSVDSGAWTDISHLFGARTPATAYTYTAATDEDLVSFRVVAANLNGNTNGTGSSGVTLEA